MTLEESRKNPSYSFKCNYTKRETMKELKEGDGGCDIWGFAEVVVGDYGVEYNFCIDNTTSKIENCSAIYRMYYCKDGDFWTTDGNNFIHYEIDFNNRNWKKQLEKAMCKAFVVLP